MIQMPTRTKRHVQNAEKQKYLIDFPFKSVVTQTYRGDCRVCRNNILHLDNMRRKQLKENRIKMGFHEAIIRSSHQQTSSQLSF